MTSPEAKTRRPSQPNDPGPQGVVGPETPDIVSSDVFVSDVKTSLSEEQYIERLEAMLKLVGLPPLAEFNRMETETEARSNKKATKPRE